MITIISCVWQRIERLAYTLNQLERQTDKDFELYLINNNSELQKDVYALAGKREFVKKIVQNGVNRGPFARLEAMVKLKSESKWFMTLDDDCNFDETLVAQWRHLADKNFVQGWAGFEFDGGDYWHKRRVLPNMVCNYVWGSNLFLSADIVSDVFANLAPKYWQCDDIWLCYCAKRYAGIDCRAALINNLSISVDGKDTYHSQHDTKIKFLNDLRSKGWNV